MLQQCFSGWMIAQPSQFKGLSAKKCAHMLLDAGWTHFGVPSVVTSEQGSRFAGQWFKTTCARLGIREAFSQAYHLQAKGRAEVAGKQLIEFLRKINAEKSQLVGGIAESTLIHP
jgi:hypothetical protein